MDAGKGRKRSWESESPIDSDTKRRDCPALATYERSPPPQHAGHYLHDSEALNQRRLPPLYTPACSTTAGPLTAGPIQPSLPARNISDFRLRSQSLFGSPQPLVAGQCQNNVREASPRALERDLPHQAIGSGTYRSQFGTDHTPHTAGEAHCCASGCKGQECAHARSLLRKLAAELVLLDSRVRLLLQEDHRSSRESPDTERVPIIEILQWALDTVSWTNLDLRDHIEYSAPRSPDQNTSQPDTASTMKRGYNYPGIRDEQSPPTRPYVPSYHGFHTSDNPASSSDPGRSTYYSNEPPPTTSSPHHTASSSSGSVFMAPHSLTQASQPTRAAMLPSPSSIHFPNVPSLPPISPPATVITQAAAQSTLLQDLQHQVSVKTISLQTLQREYDSLLQKLERQRTKCATLEKKFEVSDVEINSLADEKEKLQAQLAALELQVEELQESRDESRRQLVANGAQYMQIMEMANRLQAKSAEDKKRWDAEKVELQQRIKVLEEAMVTGDDSEQPDCSPPPSIVLAHTSSSTSSSSAETMNVLRAEIGRLRLRTQTLETAIRTMKEEGMSIQEAAKKLMESGSKIENATRGASE